MTENSVLSLSKGQVIFTIQKTIETFGLSAETKRLPYWLTQIALTCFIVNFLTQTFALVIARGDMEKLFECFSVLSFYCMGALKLKSLHTNFTKWSQLLSELNALEFEQLNNEISNTDYESDDEDTIQCFNTHISLYTEKFRSLFFKISRLYYFTLTLFIISPFIEYLYRKLNLKELVTFPHVLPVWSPLDAISFWGYLVTVASELIAAIYTVYVHTVFDLMVFGLMIFLSGQFLLLRELTEEIAGKGKGYDLTTQRDARAHYRIVRCHCTILTLENSMDTLDKLVQNILGIYFLVAVLMLCSVALRLSSEEMSVMKVIALVQYTGSCLVQLFLFCYYGDILLHKSSVGMGEGVYAAAWWRLSPRVRRQASLLAVGQARVRRLRAGPFNSLNLPSFIQIVRAAYSYYAVLRK